MKNSFINLWATSNRKHWMMRNWGTALMKISTWYRRELTSEAFSKFYRFSFSSSLLFIWWQIFGYFLLSSIKSIESTFRRGRASTFSKMDQIGIYRIWMIQNSLWQFYTLPSQVCQLLGLVTTIQFQMRKEL